MTPAEATYFLKLHGIDVVLPHLIPADPKEHGERFLGNAVLVATTGKPLPTWMSTMNVRYCEGLFLYSLDRLLVEKAADLLNGDKGGADIDAVQAERGKRYGSFDSNAALCQELKGAIRRADAENDHRLSPAQLEALDMVMHKVSRIVNGDPGYLDSWIDAESYLNLGRKWTEANGGH